MDFRTDFRTDFRSDFIADSERIFKQISEQISYRVSERISFLGVFLGVVLRHSYGSLADLNLRLTSSSASAQLANLSLFGSDVANLFCAWVTFFCALYMCILQTFFMHASSKMCFFFSFQM